jgi:hypothetical protein
LFLCLFSGFSYPLTVENLYMAEVLVVSQDEKQLSKGAQAGLLQVLVRVSGSQEVEQNPLIARSISNPKAYYYRYSYESTNKVLQISGQAVPAKLLRLHFEPSAIAKLLRQAGFSVWGSNRPGVLLWLAISDSDGRRLLSADSVYENNAYENSVNENSVIENGINESRANENSVIENSVTDINALKNNRSRNDVSEIIRTLQDQARLRGLPLLFPLLDLEDSASLSTAEVWGAFLGRIDDASIRYNPDSVLTSRFQKDSAGRWSANWSYRIDGQWQVAKTESFGTDEMIRTIVDKLADDLAARYAIDSSRGQVTVLIESVNSLGDYAAVKKYLESLAPVLDSSVMRVEPGEVEFRLSTEGQSEQLVEIIGLDEKMVLLNVDERQDALHYRWLQ